MKVAFNRKKLIEQLKDTIDINDFVTSQYGVQTKRSGKGFICCSPLREDKHPSFAIYPESRTWHDFATSESGDIIDLVRKRECCDFKTAIDRLKSYCGLTAEAITAYKPKPRTKTKIEQYNDRISELYMQIEDINAEITKRGKAQTDDTAQDNAGLFAMRTEIEGEIDMLNIEISREYKKERTTEQEHSPESMQAADHNAAEQAQSTEQPAAKYMPDDQTTTGASHIFERRFADSLVYTSAEGWKYWNGSKWEESDTIVPAMARILFDDMLHESYMLLANDKTNNGNYKEYNKLALKLQNNPNGLNYIITTTKNAFHKPLKDFDSDAEILNTPGGIVNLRTGKITAHNPKAYCTKITAVAPSADDAPEWIDFLNLITGNDPEMITYLQTVAGMAAIGRPTEQLIIAIGGGRNGKSTFFNALFKVLGEYATTYDSSVLSLDERQNRAASYAALRGARYAIGGELEAGARLSTATVKKIASTDPMAIRKLYCDQETVMPTHSPFLYTNHLPQTAALDEGIWRRLVPIPFNQVMPSGNDEIPNYDDYLVEHCGGAILQWIINGAVLYLANGSHLDEPAQVKQTKESYKASQDWLSGFLAECTIQGRGLIVNSGALFRAYQDYAKSNGEYPMNRAQFTDAMRDAGYEKRDTGAARATVWLNIGLRRNADTPADRENNG